MILKERKESNIYQHSKKIIKYFFRFIFNRKTKVFAKFLFIFFIFFGGIIFGLIVSGFFGTLDNPSQRAVNMIHAVGITGLNNMKIRIQGIMKENIKIPFNYLKGLFSDHKKIFININFENYRKLEYKREQALEKGILISSGSDYVPATINYEGKEYSVKLRLKGDLTDHIEGDKWSFRIKVKNKDAFLGMKVFSIQAPKTRNYLNEVIYHHALKNAGVLGLRYEFVDVVINGKNKGVYALEEHFSKELIENNGRREGVIIKFNEDVMWKEVARTGNMSFNNNDWFYSSVIDSFDEQRLLEDSVKFAQFNKAKNLLESFRENSLTTHEVFDTDKLAKYFAIHALLNCEHGSAWHNIRFYYNPITSLLEPIGFDGYCGEESINSENLKQYVPTQLDFFSAEDTRNKGASYFYDLVFSDEIFFSKYLQELEKVSQEQYLDDLFLKSEEEFNRNLNILYKDYSYYYFTDEIFYENQNKIKDFLNPVENINVYFKEKLLTQNKISLFIGNNHQIPIEIINVVYNDSVVFSPINQQILQSGDFTSPVNYELIEFAIPFNFKWKEEDSYYLKINYKLFGTNNLKTADVFPWSNLDEDFLEEDFVRQTPNIDSFEFLNINRDTNSLFFEKGKWTLNQSLIIPKGFTVVMKEGTEIDLMNNAMILSYSNLRFVGSEENPIKITSSDKTGQGIAVINADKTSLLKNIILENLNNPSKEEWELTGAVTFYKSPVELEKTTISDMNAEDCLNLFDSKYSLTESVIENCFSDCLDDDFGTGVIEDSSFINCGNDGMDFSAANIEIINVDIFNAGDKGLSAGEKSKININNILIDGKESQTYIGVASKDNSDLSIQNIQINNVQYGFAVYQKKSEYGPSIINALEVNISSIENNNIVEQNSELSVNELIVVGGERNVYEKLYGDVQ